MAEDEMTPLGRYLDDARRRKGMTVTDAVTAASVSRPTWYALLDGRREPRLDTVTRVAQAVGADPDRAWQLAVPAEAAMDLRRELPNLSETEITDLISAAVAELRRRADQVAAVAREAVESVLRRKL